MPTKLDGQRPASLVNDGGRASPDMKIAKRLPSARVRRLKNKQKRLGVSKVADFSLQDRLKLLNSTSWLGADGAVVSEGDSECASTAKIAIDRRQSNEDAPLDAETQENLHLLLRDWFGETETNSRTFQSPFVRAQVKLTEAMRLAEALPVPNEFISALTLNLLGSLTESFFDFREPVREAHAIMYSSIYDGNAQTPFFARVSSVQSEICELKQRRRQFAALQKKLRADEERHREMLDKSVEGLESDLLRRTFLAWRESALHSKKHNKRLQLMFSKWWIAEDNQRWYFNQWKLFYESAAVRRLNRNLDRGQADLEFHESAVNDKTRLRDKKLANVASLQDEHDKKSKAVDDKRKALAAANVGLVDHTKAIERNRTLVKKLKRLCESVAQSVSRILHSGLNELTKTPNALDILNRVNKHPRSSGKHLKHLAANGKTAHLAGTGGQSGEGGGGGGGSEGEDLVLVWLKVILGRYYASSKAKAKSKLANADPNARNNEISASITNKKLLLEGVKTLHQLVELGLGLDIVECLPPMLIDMAKEVPDDEILLGAVDIEKYNLEHVQLVSSLAKCHSVVFRGSNEAQTIQNSGNTADSGLFVPTIDAKRRRTTVVRQGTFMFSRQPSKDILTCQLSTVASPDAARPTGSHPVSLIDAKKESFLLPHNQTPGSTTVTKAELSMAEVGEGDESSDKEENEDQSFVDETLPLVGIEELLEAFDPTRHHEQSMFLKTFLLTFFLGNPILGPVVPETHEAFQQLRDTRAALQELLNPSKQNVELAPGEKPPGHKSIETENKEGDEEKGEEEVRNLDELEQNVDQMCESWKRLIFRCSDIQRSFGKRAGAWPRAKRQAERGVWRLLCTQVHDNRNDKSDSHTPQQGSSDTSQDQVALESIITSPHSTLLRILQGKTGTQQVTLVTNRQVTEVTKAILSKRFRGVQEANDIAAAEATKERADLVDDSGSESDIGVDTDSSSSASSSGFGESLGDSVNELDGGSYDVTSGSARAMCEFLDTISLALKRYSTAGSVIDLIKEANLIDSDKLISKKLKAKFVALSPESGRAVELHHIIETLIFAAERHIDTNTAPKASDLEIFPQLLRTFAMEKLVHCESLVNRELYHFKEAQLDTLKFTFEKMRTKASPVGQISLNNWKNAIDLRKSVLLDKVHVSKAALVDIFMRCCGTREHGAGLFETMSDDKAAGLCFTQFVSAIVKVAMLKFPDPFQPLDTKLRACLDIFI